MRGITVNVVSPGFTDTGMVAEFRHTEQTNIQTRAIRRGATPQDVVGPIAFFLSDDAAFVTGQNLYVDGGSVMP
jgi:3-oxoacyl-[acyl-carrier protein] reductase